MNNIINLTTEFYRIMNKIIQTVTPPPLLFTVKKLKIRKNNLFMFQSILYSFPDKKTLMIILNS